MRRKHLRKGLIVTALLLAISIMALVHTELEAARERRQACGLGTKVASSVLQESAQTLLEGLLPHDEGQVASSTGGLISDHDLFMLVEAARFWVQRDEDLSSALAQGRLPASYALLDGYDLNRVALRRCIAQDLPTMETSQRLVAPVLLGFPASPSVHDIASGIVDDDPLMSLHTQGQILSTDVWERGTHYTLGCVKETPQARANEILLVKNRVIQLVDEIEQQAGRDADDYAYTRTAFDLIANSVSYADREQGATPHDNDVYGALVQGSARCYGLCGALKLLLDVHGIPNYIADGTKPTGRHSWNVIWIGGSWRVCDLTLRINSCLALEQNFYTAHHYSLDPNCRILELVYSRLLA